MPDRPALPRPIRLLPISSFVTGTEAFVHVGHLRALAEELGVGIGVAGQLATAHAFACAASAPILAAVLGRQERRGVLVAGLAGQGGLNLLAVTLDRLPALNVVKLGCGVAAGIVGPTATAMATELAPADARGRAIGVVASGIAAAFLPGVPAGSAIGEGAGWRGTFAFAGLLALGAALLLRLGLPVVRPEAGVPAPALDALRRTGVRPALAMTALGFAATFCVTAYLGPVLGAVAGLGGAGGGAMQALIGAARFVGITLGGRIADRPDAGRALVASLLVSAVALLLYAVLLVVALPRPLVLGLLGGGILAGAAALFLRTPIVQLRLAAAAPTHRPVLFALNGSAVLLGQAAGAALGGVAIRAVGLPALGVLGACLALAGAAVAVAAERRR